MKKLPKFVAIFRCFTATLLLTICCSPSFATDVENGFVSLFDGKTFDGWTGAIESYEISNGVLSAKAGAHGGLYSANEYDNFELRFEFRLTPGANNGVALRAPLEGDPAYVGMEAQLLDNTADKYKTLKPYQFSGSIYGVAAAKRGFLQPVEEWNEESIICDGRKITVTLNGEVILDVDLDVVAPDGKAIDGKKHPGLKRTSGHIGFLGHHDHVDFRNIRIRKIESRESTATESSKE